MKQPKRKMFKPDFNKIRFLLDSPDFKMTQVEIAKITRWSPEQIYKVSRFKTWEEMKEFDKKKAQTHQDKIRTEREARQEYEEDNNKAKPSLLSDLRNALIPKGKEEANQQPIEIRLDRDQYNTIVGLLKAIEYACGKCNCDK